MLLLFYSIYVKIKTSGSAGSCRANGVHIGTTQECHEIHCISPACCRDRRSGDQRVQLDLAGRRHPQRRNVGLERPPCRTGEDLRVGITEPRQRPSFASAFEGRFISKKLQVLL